MRQRNWPLLFGAAVTGAVTLIAIAGPLLAPRDPLQENFILQTYTGVWLPPPFPPFTVPGFWLGSDLQGRDLLSRLLWAVRPTLSLVVTVAATRLSLGTLVGLAAGWTKGRWAQALEPLITAALSIPVIIVALAAIAAVGIDTGLIAFIIGLSLTGWGETARVVREQTRSLQGQLYIEAARALGLSELQIITRHVVQQIAPMLWMLLAFEISGTLLTTATLGFLGYYLGGGVWLQVGDFVVQRISGLPELGQMLAIAAENRMHPEAMVAAGTLIFISVLGFNLLGEGLRRQLSLTRRSERPTLLDRVGEWVEGRVLPPLARRLKPNVWSPRALWVWLFTAALILSVLGWFKLPAQPSPSAETVLAIPGNHLWGSERRDPQGTLTIDALGPASADKLWEFETAGGITGGPMVTAEGLVIIGSQQKLYALEPTGQVRWQTPLDHVPAGSPALGLAKEIYLADVEGGLSAYTSDGKFKWRFPGERQTTAIASPIIGLDGTIYYALEGLLHAVSPEGKLVWAAVIPFGYIYPLPTLDPTGKYVFFEDVVVDAKTGQHLFGPTKDSLDKLFVGVDRRLYLRSESSVVEWRLETANATTVPSLLLDMHGLGYGFPNDSGVTRSQLNWLLFSGGFQDSRLVWVDASDKVLGSIRVPQRNTRVVGVDSASTLYACGNNRRLGPECQAFGLGLADPLWQFSLPAGDLPSGGALIAGRLYVTTSGGMLYALGK